MLKTPRSFHSRASRRWVWYPGFISILGPLATPAEGGVHTCLKSVKHGRGGGIGAYAMLGSSAAHAVEG
eukprot:1394195-Pyramimonas_sp.AAC.1